MKRRDVFLLATAMMLLLGVTSLWCVGCAEDPFASLRPYEVVSISLTPKNPIVKVGDALTFSPTWTLRNGQVNPARNSVLRWSSSLPSVATIDPSGDSGGVAHAVSEGDTVIEVEVEDMDIHDSTVLRVIP